MRRSFDGLAMMVEYLIGQNPLSGHLFVFRNRRGDKVKILYWDRDGWAIWYKRLEKSTFRLPESNEGSIELSATDLYMILEGIELCTIKRRKRFSLSHSLT
jgi:transposase